MKKMFLFLLLTLSTSLLFSQEITKGDVINLFYRAQKAEKSNNMQEALEIYKTILALDANLPIPYLKIADIYAADKNNEKSAADAIVLYNKYLKLQSNDENTSTIKNKIAYLKQFIASEQNTNLDNILYIDKEQAQNVIETKAKRGSRANTKEELEQQIEATSALYNQAEEAIKNNDIQTGTEKLEQLTENSDIASPTNAQAYMQLANSYMEQGDVAKMKDVLSDLESNIEANKSLLEYYGYKVKDLTPFEDDICGIWVSDYSVDKNSLPYFAVKIDKVGDGNYSAVILPYCTFSKTVFDKQAKNINSDTCIVVTENNTISFSFGYEEFKKGASAGLVELGQTMTGEVGKAATEAIAANLDNSYMEATFSTVAIQVGTALIQSLIGSAATSTQKATLVNTDIKRIFAGCAELDLIQTTMVEKSTGYEKESTDTRQIKIYKLYPEYNILFADKKDELFGYKLFGKDDIMQMDEYSHIQAMKDKEKGDFNRESYKKLSQKVNDYCWEKVNENPEMKVMAYLISESFKYATQGLSKTTFQNKTGYFEGWTNTSGAMNGAGICHFSNGDEYIGNWNNNKFSGNGKLTKKDKDGNFLFEYTGTFEKNKSDGKGIFRNSEMTYEGDFDKGKFNGTGTMTLISGETYNGIFKNDVFREGSGSYDEGIFTGKWKQIKKDNKKILVPDGNGSMIIANGETLFGKWKNGIYQSKK